MYYFYNIITDGLVCEMIRSLYYSEDEVIISVLYYLDNFYYLFHKKLSRCHSEVFELLTFLKTAFPKIVKKRFNELFCISEVF